MVRIGIEQLRLQMADTINRACYGHERIILQRRGKDVAAIVPVEDLELLDKLVEQLEDRVDTAEAEQILEDIRSGKTKALPWEKARKQLGLDE